MRQLSRSLLLALGLLAVAPAYAVDDGTKEAPPASEDADEGAEGSVTYSGIGLSRVSTDFDNVEDAINLNAVIGFRIPTVKVFAIELELASTIIPGQVNSQNCTTTPGSGGGPLGPIFGGGTDSSTNCANSEGDFGINSAGVYAVLRSPGRFYGMAKTGYRYVTSSIDQLNEERSGSAWALGGGYRWNPRKNNGVELYYNKFGDQLSFIGFGLSYGFGGRD